MRAALSVFWLLAAWLAVVAPPEIQAQPAGPAHKEFRLAAFSAEVTCPVGHPLLAGLIQPAKEIADPLFVHGLVLLGPNEPLVFCAVDWCEIRNQSYDQWRAMLAKAANTTKERVLLCALHQHDAPVTDLGAAVFLKNAGMEGKMFDPAFEAKSMQQTAKALAKALPKARKITHLGVGMAKVDKIASNRRVVMADGKIVYNRNSASGGNKVFRDASEGLVDPWLRILSFWDGDQAVAALHTYATHPMSYYGQGSVTADFIGLARALMQKEHPGVVQLYASGCSGDVTAGKYNDGSPANRPLLAQRLFQAMKQAWKETKTFELGKMDFRLAKVDLEFRKSPAYSKEAMTKVLGDTKQPPRNRILAAMGLASLQRVESGQKIDFPCVDFGPAQLILFPGEAFVAYQLAAQAQRPDSFVMSVGYGECWPGYIPSTQAFKENFDDIWYWVAPGSDQRLQAALDQVLPKKKA
jgi:hypothetical protein